MLARRAGEGGPKGPTPGNGRCNAGEDHCALVELSSRGNDLSFCAGDVDGFPACDDAETGACVLCTSNQDSRDRAGDLGLDPLTAICVRDVAPDSSHCSGDATPTMCVKPCPTPPPAA